MSKELHETPDAIRVPEHETDKGGPVEGAWRMVDSGAPEKFLIDERPTGINLGGDCVLFVVDVRRRADVEGDFLIVQPDVLKEDPTRGWEALYLGETKTLGRGYAERLAIPPTASRAHARVSVDADPARTVLQVEDAGSTNGTFVERGLYRLFDGRSEAKAPEARRLERAAELNERYRVRSAAESVAKNHPNQDSYLNEPTRRVFGVFDGVGGHLAGEVASGRLKSAIDQASTLALERELDPSQNQPLLANAFEQVHAELKEMDGEKSPATTAAVLMVAHELDGRRTALIAHAGDSRVYRLRAGNLECLTADDGMPHSDPDVRRRQQERLARVETDDDLSRLSESDRAAFLSRHRISNAIGGPEMRPHFQTVPIEVGDMFLVCTDGVHDNLSDRRIGELLNAHQDPDGAAKMVVDAAFAESQQQRARNHPRAKRDDITAIVVRLD